MNRRHLAAAGMLGLVPMMSGCITFYSKTEVVRSEEPRRAVSFETAAAAEKFGKAAKLDEAKQVGGTHLGVPFVTLYERRQWLAENAKFNDAILRCDSNQDGLITEQEVEAFAKLHSEQPNGSEP